MVSARKLALFGTSLVVLSLFITTVVSPTLDNTKLPDTVYKTNEKGEILTENGLLLTNEPDKEPGIITKAINVTGVKTFNAVIALFPLFLGVGGLLAIIQEFKNKG